MIYCLFYNLFLKPELQYKYIKSHSKCIPLQIKNQRVTPNKVCIFWEGHKILRNLYDYSPYKKK